MSSGRFSRHRHQARDYLKLHGDAENLLREVVVNLSRDAVALLQHGAEARAHPAQTQRVELPREQTEADGAERVEPGRAVEVRPQPETDGGGRATPHTVVVTGDDLEPVVAGAEVRVIGHAAVAAVNPILVETQEPVLVPDLFGRDGVRGCDKSRRSAGRRAW